MEVIHEDEGGKYVLIPVGKHHVKRYIKDIRRYRPGIFNPFLIAKALESVPVAAPFPIHRSLQFDDPPHPDEYPDDTFGRRR